MAEVTTSVHSLEITDHQDYDDEAYSDPVYLNTVTDQQTPLTNSWNVQVTIANKKVLFKVDTGAEVTAMSDSAWESVREQAGPLERSKQQLCGPDRQPLTVIGTATLKAFIGLVYFTERNNLTEHSRYKIRNGTLY